MGTLADKLSYVNETKQQIKSAIVKKGVTVADTDTFRSYANKIASIVVSKTQTKNVTLTSASATTITPDSSYTGLDKVVVTPATQTKDIKLTSAGATTITPDSGKVGLTSVKVTPQRQEKSISVTANQTYTATPDANYVGLSKVTVKPVVETNKTVNITKNGQTTVNVSSGKVGMAKVTVNTNIAAPVNGYMTKLATIGEHSGWTGHKSLTLSPLSSSVPNIIIIVISCWNTVPNTGKTGDNYLRFILNGSTFGFEELSYNVASNSHVKVCYAAVPAGLSSLSFQYAQSYIEFMNIYSARTLYA